MPSGVFQRGDVPSGGYTRGYPDYGIPSEYSRMYADEDQQKE